jgi:hypothetical protein
MDQRITELALEALEGRKAQADREIAERWIVTRLFVFHATKSVIRRSGAGAKPKPPVEVADRPVLPVSVRGRHCRGDQSSATTREHGNSPEVLHQHQVTAGLIILPVEDRALVWGHGYTV